MDELEKFVTEELWPLLRKTPNDERHVFQHVSLVQLSPKWGTKTAKGLAEVIKRLAKESK